MKRPLLTMLAAAMLLPNNPCIASDFLSEQACQCGKQALFPAAVGDAPGRKYARDRLIDVSHLALEVTPDFAKRTVAGNVTLTFKAIALPLAELQLDAVDLAITKVVSSAPLAEWQSTGQKLILTFSPPLAPDVETTVTVDYSARPERGLYFRTPEMGYPQGDTQVWSQGEAELHRFWFPCYDYPNERFTSEVKCHVPVGMEVISNGSLIEKKPTAAGMEVWHWKQSQPHVNYLIALAAGYFHKLESKVGALPLALFVPPSEQAQAAAAFRDTAAVIEFYNQEIGVPFPWDKYYQVYCHDFVAGGMENTSCTFMAAKLLFPESSEQLHTVQGIDAHEIAHQWFGDLVTCRDWAHLWLNEGFATFYPMLYEQHKTGRDGMLIDLWGTAQRVLDSGDLRPIVWRDYRDPMDQFGSRAYPKGAWVLNMLRSQLGPDLFRKGIKHYLERHRNGIVTSDDLQDALEEVSGRSFDQFFDQWLHHGGWPELEAAYSWDAQSKQARVSIKQKQKVTTEVPLFKFPLPVRFHMPNNAAAKEFTVTVSQESEEYYFALPEAPAWVRFDPELTVLARWTFTPPNEMLKHQLKGDVIGRILAIHALSDRKDEESVKALQEILNGDPRVEVRQEAAKALKKIGNELARKALIASLAQPDARARLEVVSALGAFTFHREARDALWQHASQEKNPEILAEIIQSWGTRPGEPEVTAALQKFLTTPSYENVLASAAIAAFKAQDDATAIPAVLAELKRSQAAFPTGALSQAMQAVAFLARNEPKSDEVFHFLTAQLNHPREAVQTAAAQALGTLNDPRALAFLRPLTTVRKPFKNPVREAAATAIQQIESRQTGPAELSRLWNELQILQKKNQDLEAEMEKLKKKQDAKK